MLRLVRLVMGSADPPFAGDDSCLSNAQLMEWFGGLAIVALKLLAAMSTTTKAKLVWPWGQLREQILDRSDRRLNRVRNADKNQIDRRRCGREHR